jgi:hypothetical protein
MSERPVQVVEPSNFAAAVSHDHAAVLRAAGVKSPQEIVAYENIQFTKAPNVLRGMGLAHLSKNETAIKELTDKGMASK